MTETIIVGAIILTVVPLQIWAFRHDFKLEVRRGEIIDDMRRRIERLEANK